MRHTHVAILFFFHVSALLLTDEHDGGAVDHGRPSHNGVVVTEGAVPVQFKKVITHEPDIVGCVRAIFMTGNLDSLPRSQIFIDLCRTPLQITFGILQLA